MFGSKFFRMLTDERGQGLVEYALILGVISVVAFISLTYLGHQTNNQLYNKISNAMNSVGQ